MRQPLLKNEIRIKLAKKYLKNGNKHVWKTKGTITPIKWVKKHLQI